MRKLLLIALLLPMVASAQFILRTDSLMYVNRTGDTVRLNKTRGVLNNLYTKAAGTTYTLAATAAKVTFGTTSPTLTFPEAGTYLVMYNCRTDYTAATLAASRTVTYKVRRTNNGATDLDDIGFTTPIITLLTYSAPRQSNAFLYTAAVGDVLELWGSISVIPTAGTVKTVEANMNATKLY